MSEQPSNRQMYASLSWAQMELAAAQRQYNQVHDSILVEPVDPNLKVAEGL